MIPSNKRSTKNKPKIVVIGGGTGTSVVISGLKNKPVELTAIITAADSGGSTGRLRDEFGFLPVGDMRQSLAALAKENSQDWIRQLLLYRFSVGQGLKGHNLGNLILTALQDMAGSTPQALEIAERVFRLDGNIYPSTISNVQLVTTYADGTKVTGEHYLDDKKFGGKKITSIALKPEAKIYSRARAAIREAKLIIIGPGDLYGSILPNLIVKGMAQALKQTRAKIVYIINLMTRFTQTSGMTARDHVAEITKYLGRRPDIIVINSGKIAGSILKAYQREHEYPVVDDLGQDKSTVRDNLVFTSVTRTKTSDSIRRSLLRHDQKKLADFLVKYLK